MDTACISHQLRLHDTKLSFRCLMFSYDLEILELQVRALVIFV